MEFSLNWIGLGCQIACFDSIKKLVKSKSHFFYFTTSFYFFSLFAIFNDQCWHECFWYLPICQSQDITLTSKQFFLCPHMQWNAFYSLQKDHLSTSKWNFIAIHSITFFSWINWTRYIWTERKKIFSNNYSFSTFFAKCQQ